MKSRGAGEQEVVLFTPDVTETSTIKRAEEFLDRGYGITVFGFRRDRYNRDYDPAWPHILLGRTEDGNYRQRLRALLGAAPAVFAHRRRLKRAAILYARNIDQLLLALLTRLISGRRAILVYEVLDIPPVLVGRGFSSVALRLIERFCLRRVDLLVLSSPAFFHNYFARYQRYRKEWFLLENKLHRSALPEPEAWGRPPSKEPERGGYRWIIGYFGLIRGRNTFDLITRIAARLRGTVLFKFRGVLTTVDRQHFETALQQNPNMIYQGGYVNPGDLGEMYGGVDFAWALDIEHADHNSRWLRPCRFYEAGLYGVPSLAIRGFEIGTHIEKLEVGWTFAEPFEDALVRFFEELAPAEYAEKRARLMALPIDTFVAGDDMDALCRWFSARQGTHRTAPTPMARSASTMSTDPSETNAPPERGVG